MDVQRLCRTCPALHWLRPLGGPALHLDLAAQWKLALVLGAWMRHLESISVGNMISTRRLWDGVSTDVMPRSLTTSGLWKSCPSSHELGRTSLPPRQLELTLVMGTQVKRPQELESGRAVPEGMRGELALPPHWVYHSGPDGKGTGKPAPRL